MSDHARLHVRLTPGAAHDRIDGWDVDADGRDILKCRVRAKPIEGQANAALIALLSQALKVRKADVVIARGDQSRSKAVEVEGLSLDDIHSRLTDL
ncbi:MAG: DUF167 domain-containing protein [Brevundimonas sp.]|nr:MAG: DUF167 domain-containing protein [Brevundimonas sp.]